MASLTVGIVAPRPPFTVGDTGLDIDLMRALAARLGEDVAFARAGQDIDAVLDGLDGAPYDCVAGATVSEQCEVTFLPPYVITGQALAVHTRRLRTVGSIDDLTGLTIGVQGGGTGEALARRLVDDGKAAAVRVHPDLDAAIADLAPGGCDGVLALAPVLTAMTRDVPDVDVVQRGLSVEEIAIAVGPANQALAARLQVAQAELESDGTLQELRRTWLGNPYTDQSTPVL